MKKVMYVLLLCIAIPVMAQQPVIKPTVAVTGEGTVNVIPDEVNIVVGVEHEGKDASEVKTENDLTVDAVLKVLKQAKLKDKDYQTQYVRLNKSYNYNSKVYMYQASQTIQIHLTDLSKYETLMQELLKSGVNAIQNVTFTSSKIESLKEEARRKAVSNAKEKAVAYASVLDQKVGKAITITEAGSANVPPTPMYEMQKMSLSNSGSQETLAIGEMEVTATIQIVFELD